MSSTAEPTSSQSGHLPTTVTKISSEFRDAHSKGCPKCGTSAEDTTKLIECTDRFSVWIDGLTSDSRAEFQSQMHTLSSWVRGEDPSAASVSHAELLGVVLHLSEEYNKHQHALQGMLSQETAIHATCDALSDMEGWCEDSRQVLLRVRDATDPLGKTSATNWLSCAESILKDATSVLLGPDKSSEDEGDPLDQPVTEEREATDETGEEGRIHR